MNFLEDSKAQIIELCKACNVKSLYSFGSVNGNKFHELSDIDLLVDFQTSDPLEYTENYFNLKFSLEKLLKRSIDLLEIKALKNPFLRAKIDASKVLVYGD
jgi:uncharacterized protein